MASDKPSYGWSEISAAEQKKIPLPDRFLCRECHKFKSPTQYSNKQLNDYRFKIHTRQHVTNISAKLRCRNCTGEQTQELQCTGPCALWKGLEDFSKNQRKRPENAWCEGCTQWKEANEPGVTPEAAPNSLLSPDEEREVVETESSPGAYTTNDIEGEADSDDEEGVPGFVYDSMNSLNVGNNNIAGSRDRRGKSLISNAVPVPGYLIGSTRVANAPDTKSSLSNPYEARSEHSSIEGDQQSGVTLSEKNILDTVAGGENLPHRSGTGWAKNAERKPKTGMVYNAWDNVGQMYAQYRTISQTTAVTGPSLPSRPGFQGHSASLSKQTSAANPLNGTTNSPAKQAVSPAETGGWAKQPTGKNPPPQFPALSRPITQHIYDEDDDSPDEI